MDELLNRAYDLACFIHGDEASAMRVTLAAASKLEVAAAAQDKRLYYTPAGRAENRKSRTRVSLSEPHLLQRLVYVESEPFEKEKERNGSPGEEDMIVHFIKHLARITLKRNSFYVTLGLGRVLHNYSTPETMEIHNLVAQDPERVRDESYYRACKGRLMQEMKDRFDGLLQIARVNRGEERFEVRQHSSPFAGLARECLDRFTPWLTPCVVPGNFDPLSDEIKALSFSGDDPDHEHQTEVNRIHAVMHPDCFERLARALNYDAPASRLEIPRFMNSKREDPPAPPRRRSGPLRDEEMYFIKATLAEQSSRRRAATAALLRIKIDGEERAAIDLERTSRARIDLDPSAELIEVVTDDERGELLLAAHLFDETSTSTRITLESGQRISFDVSIHKDSMGQVVESIVDVACKETNPFRAAALFFRQKMASASGLTRMPALKPALAFGVVILIIAGLLFYLRTNDAGKESRAQDQPAPEIREDQPQQAHNDESTNPSPDQPDDKKPAPDGKEKERTLIAQNQKPTEEDPLTGTTRGPRTATGASLTEVKRICIETTGDGTLSARLKSLLTLLMDTDSRLSVTENRDEADALLKVFVKSESAESPQKISATVRLINATGFVIWPAIKEGSGSVFAGSSEEVADAIINRLSEDIRKSKK